MDLQQLQALEANCTQENLPRCTAACPIHVDVRGMMAAVRTGDFSAGYDLFAKMAPFPGIISRVCDHPCQEACKRVEVEDGIAINALERACRDFTTNPLIKNNRIPNRDKKVAVVGAGISGLTVALNLAKKGYKLTVFDAGNEFGGRLLEIPEDKLPRQIMADDFEMLTDLGVQAKFGATVGNNDDNDVLFSDLLTEFDAVYLGLGQIKAADLVLGLEMDSNGCIRIDPVTLGTKENNVEIIASMPCYLEENVNAQRGEGVYHRNIRMLQKLNRLGYGVATGLKLHLVYNPGGDFLPGPQSELEAAYKENLRERFGITFNNLYTITNAPIGRFKTNLEKQGQLKEYIELLADNFNPANLTKVMCRDLVNVDWQGRIYDCDFNQALQQPMEVADNYIGNIKAQDLVGTPIKLGLQCFTCVAGAGSSCQGCLNDEAV